MVHQELLVGGDDGLVAGAPGDLGVVLLGELQACRHEGPGSIFLCQVQACSHKLHLQHCCFRRAVSSTGQGSQ